MSIPISQFITHPHSFLVIISLFFYICDSICFVNKFICAICLDSTYKQCHMLFVFLCLTYFTQYDNLWVHHVTANGILSFSFMTVYMYHFFLHFSVHGYLGCFHVLAIVNHAAMNIVVHVFFQLWFSWNICPGVGLLDHMVALVLVF